MISDSGPEIYSFLRQRGIVNLLVMGVHTNMCVLNRAFAIKKMTALGIRCILVRDSTDAMYNPQDAPHVSHDAGTQLVIEYIEKFWAPTDHQRRTAAGIPPLGGDHCAAWRMAADSMGGAPGERRARISRCGGWPKKRLYSRLN